jgi:maltooligosyltrehalose trehalohydrolase
LSFQFVEDERRAASARIAARRWPVGAELVPAGVSYRIWARGKQRVEVVIKSADEERNLQLDPEADGYFSVLDPRGLPGDIYRYRLDDDSSLYPDPASRYQPQGPHGPSQVVDPSRFAWTDQAWRGVAFPGQVLYEMHFGTFTPEGTYRAAAEHLPYLRDLGATVLEVMPVAEFPGDFGWGYDGVNLYAPTRLYGTPDDLRFFIDRAHELGLAVILDVVYNHLGPDGNYLTKFSEEYFSNRHVTEWGDALNFDGSNAGPVRELFIHNAAYWIEEFHFDGLRLDATQAMFDDSPRHVLCDIVNAVRAAAKGRGTLVIAENEPQRSYYVRSQEDGGYGLDALWNDDFHHSAAVALTGKNEAYYSDYLGKPQEFVSALKYGYLYQGQRYQWQKQRRGHPALDLEPCAFVNFIENHDQVANSARGRRLWQLSSLGRYRAMTVLLLLAPATPMLFQGQEFGSSKPFVYFAHHNPALAKLVRKGRAEFLAQFPGIATGKVRAQLDVPDHRATFEKCKLDFSERDTHHEIYRLHRDLLALRRTDPVVSCQNRRSFDGAVLSDAAFLLRYFDAKHGDRLILVNLGRDLRLVPTPEPLLAPPVDKKWQILWSSEEPEYGGTGTPAVDTEQGWRIPGEAAVLLAAVAED